MVHERYQNMSVCTSIARIFPWGGPKYRFQNFGKFNLGKYPGGVVTFPNYLNGYVPPNRVVILERFRSLGNSVCRVASQSVFYCGRRGDKNVLFR